MKKAILILVTFVIVFAAKAQWIQSGDDFEGSSSSERLGNAVSINSDGSIIALGAPSEYYTGYVKLFQKNGDIWSQIGGIIESESVQDKFGYSVGLSSDGSIVAIGAPYNHVNGVSSGQVRVFQNQSGSWVPIGESIDGENEGDNFGNSLSINADGSIVAIGANKNDNFGYKSGNVKVFQNQGGSWVQIGNEIYGDHPGDECGSAVSLNDEGNILAVGANKDGNFSSVAGQVRIYQFVDDSWEQIGDEILGESSNDESASSLDLNAEGNIIAIGAPKNDGNGNKAGHVRVYQNNAGIWEQLGNDIDGAAEEDYLGTSVSLNSDGYTVAVGSPENDTNGNGSGSVSIYEFVDGDWTLKGAEINGESELNGAGFSVSLNADGSSIVIGAPRTFDGAPLAGQARVFEYLDVAVFPMHLEEESSLIYPNPSKGLITIRGGLLKINNLLIFNSRGEIVKELHFTDNTLLDSENEWIKLDLTTEPIGLYIIKIEKSNTTTFHKYIKF